MEEHQCRCNSCKATVYGAYHIDNGYGTTYVFCGCCVESFDFINVDSAKRMEAHRVLQEPNQILIRAF